MKTAIINAAKNWAFNSTFFAGTVMGFSELTTSQPVFIWICSGVGVIVMSVLAAFGAEAITEQFKKHKDKWNGIGNQKRTQQSSG